MDTKKQGSRLQNKIPIAPASFFAMTLGLAETGNALRIAHDTWGGPQLWSELLEGLAVLSFIWWGFLYVSKWINHRADAQQEWKDPVQGSFIALIPESVLLLSAVFLPYHLVVAHVLFWAGSVSNLLIGAIRLSGMWKYPRSGSQITPSLFLTYTASVLVNALMAGLFGYTELGWMIFGIGAVSWIILDSVIFHQLVTGGLASKARNFMGIYMAPAAIMLVAYQVLSGKSSDFVTYALAGYSLFLIFSLALSYKWLREQQFAPGYWAYTFGIATVAQGLLFMVNDSKSPFLIGVTAIVLAASVLVTLSVAIGSVYLLLSKRYYPPVAVSKA
jgi:Tellurite resistance protein and related permeases